MEIFKKCKVKNCENKYRSKGYCISHYMQIWRYGKIIDEQKKQEKEKRMNKVCKVKNCNNSSYYKKGGANGFCNKHQSQIYQYKKILKRTKFDINEVIDCGNYREICLYNVKHKEIGRALIDKKDLDKIKGYKWCLNNFGYVMTIKNKKIILLHHLILGKPLRGYNIDHINHNTLDNRKQNLRFVTYSQNSMNRKSKGYIWVKDVKKWKVQIYINHKQITLGYFINEQNAINARKKAEQKYFGEFAYIKN
jgi:hypothetical protein